jgi:hypothetical protein
LVENDFGFVSFLVSTYMRRRKFSKALSFTLMTYLGAGWKERERKRDKGENRERDIDLEIDR